MSHLVDMEDRLILHIVDGDSRSRAEQARTAFALGHHAEVYWDLGELLERPPHEGTILLRQRAMDVPLDELSGRLGDQGVWLPVIVCAEDPMIEQVVSAIKSGALDYLKLPLETGRLERSLARVTEEADAHGRARLLLAEARRRVAMLSKREREVLELLSVGSSNKLIARELGISPRTVEIHRANMMAKLGAGHAAEAVRIWLQAELDATVEAVAAETSVAEGGGSIARPDFARAIPQGIPEVVGEDEPEDTDEDGARDLPASRRARSG